MSDKSNEEVEKAKAEAEAAKAEAVAAKAQAEALKAEKESIEKEVKGLRNKDFNFRRLEQMTQEEKDALTEQELALKRRQEELDDKLSAHEKNVKDDWRSAAIEKHSKGDADRAKRISEALKDLAGEETDRASIEARVAKAAKLARDDKDIDHVGNAFGGMNGSPPDKAEEKSFADSEAGQSLASKLGLGYVKVKK